jgi:alpha-glucosidase (family GH31 glycosyl hydrolase)
MARWTQLGIFSPILRLHSSTSTFNTREPWVYSEETQKIVTAALQYRHRLIPYLYSCAVIAATEYKNLVEPVYYDYPETPEAYVYKTQFTFGPSIMVLPIVAPKSKETQLGRAEGWLPPGRWVDMFTGTVYDGDRVISLYRPVDQYPALVREGGIIPLDARDGKEIENGTGLPEAIEITVVVGKDGLFDLVEDDGKGAEVEEVNFSRTPIRWNQESGVLSIGKTSNPLLSHRTWSVRLLSHTPKSTKVSVDGKEVKNAQEEGSTIIHLGRQSADSEITLEVDSNPSLDKIDQKQRIYKLLQRAQVGVNVKGVAWAAVQQFGKDSTGKILGRIKASGIEEDVREAIEELLLAYLS